MENKFEEKLKLGYEEYLKLPKAECSGVNRETELYTNRWYIMMGRSIVHPHPHRHYTFLEFVYWCGKDENLYNRFLKSSNTETKIEEQN
jgi:hypothetical protein